MSDKQNDDDDDEKSINSDSDDEDEFPFIESKWQDSVETGLIISWPPAAPRVVELSTKLPEDAIAPLFDGTQWAGTRVWKAAIVALEYLVEHDDENYTSLLELGCGLGVPGMLWYCWKQMQIEKKNDGDKTAACEVVLTDQPDLLTQLQGNLESNFTEEQKISALPLSWSREGILEILATTKFDVCLNCDCIYTPLYGRDSWLALGDVLETVAKESPSTLLVTSVERRNGDGLEEFLERLQATGAVQEIERVLRNEEDKHHVIEIYVTKGKTIR
jgi:hypothetical protein